MWLKRVRRLKFVMCILNHSNVTNIIWHEGFFWNKDNVSGVNPPINPPIKSLSLGTCHTCSEWQMRSVVVKRCGSCDQSSSWVFEKKVHNGNMKVPTVQKPETCKVTKAHFFHVPHEGWFQLFSFSILSSLSDVFKKKITLIRVIKILFFFFSLPVTAFKHRVGSLSAYH